MRLGDQKQFLGVVGTMDDVSVLPPLNKPWPCRKGILFARPRQNIHQTTRIRALSLCINSRPFVDISSLKVYRRAGLYFLVHVSCVKENLSDAKLISVVQEALQ